MEHVRRTYMERAISNKRMMHIFVCVNNPMLATSTEKEL